MKKKNLTMACAVFALITANGCLTTNEQNVAEPSLNSKTNNPELIVDDIEVIEMEDTTGRVTAAREASRKLISDAKLKAKELTRQAENIYDLKKNEAEQSAAKIIKDANLKADKITKDAKLKADKVTKDAKKASLSQNRTIAKKNKKQILDASKKIATKDKNKALAEMKATFAKKEAKIAKDLANKEAKLSKNISKKEADIAKIAKKVINNAKKTAALLTKASAKKAKEIEKAGAAILSKAKKYAVISKKEADDYLTKKMKEADKAVSDFSKKLEEKTAKAAKENKVIPKSASEKTATVILDKLLKAIPTNNYKDFSANFTPDLKTRFSKEKFIETNKVLNDKLGECTNKTYLGYILKGPLTIYIWKGNFKKLPKNNELVIRMTLGDLDKKLQVFAFDISMM